jgi:hypothetical protein
MIMLMQPGFPSPAPAAPPSSAGSWLSLSETEDTQEIFQAVSPSLCPTLRHIDVMKRKEGELARENFTLGSPEADWKLEAESG